MLQSGRLKIAPELPNAAILVQELQSFEVRITPSGHATYAADWRQGTHDDLVLSLACALWFAGIDVRLPSTDPRDYAIARR